MSALSSVYKDRRVFVTGHTGFKGSWLCHWLKELGARVCGFALDPEPGRPSLFKEARVAEGLLSVSGDVRRAEDLSQALNDFRPEVVFHLAAQALVRRSYRLPEETMATNVMGVVNLLEAVRKTFSAGAVVVVTSDKCYRNDETSRRAFREEDPLGGADPYSASKAAAEIAAAAYQDSFFSPMNVRKNKIGLATARAGNVIGGGDWAEDRLVPDCMRALSGGRVVKVRHPEAVRPWQHVLEPTAGYLWLGAKLLRDPKAFHGAWNFGPLPSAGAPVKELVALVLSEWGEKSGRMVLPRARGEPAESATLSLDPSKAAAHLGWKTVYSLPQAVRETAAYYRGRREARNFDGAAILSKQIASYVVKARSEGLPWAA